MGKIENKMGIRGSQTGELVFEDCEIPAENLLGKEGEGFKIALRDTGPHPPRHRGAGAGHRAGRARLGGEVSRKQRVQFDKPIIGEPGRSSSCWPIWISRWRRRANSIYHVGELMDAGAPRFSRESAIAKTFASDAAIAVTNDAIQVLGGYGYMKEFPVERMMRDAKITQIYEGTNQIQRMVIARALMQ